MLSRAHVKAQPLDWCSLRAVLKRKRFAREDRIYLKSALLGTDLVLVLVLFGFDVSLGYETWWSMGRRYIVMNLLK